MFLASSAGARRRRHAAAKGDEKVGADENVYAPFSVNFRDGTMREASKLHGICSHTLIHCHRRGNRSGNMRTSKTKNAEAVALINGP